MNILTLFTKKEVAPPAPSKSLQSFSATEYEFKVLLGLRDRRSTYIERISRLDIEEIERRIIEFQEAVVPLQSEEEYMIAEIMKEKIYQLQEARKTVAIAG